MLYGIQLTPKSNPTNNHRPTRLGFIRAGRECNTRFGSDMNIKCSLYYRSRRYEHQLAWIWIYVILFLLFCFVSLPFLPTVWISFVGVFIIVLSFLLPTVAVAVTQTRGHIAGSSPRFPLRHVCLAFLSREDVSPYSGRIARTHGRRSQ